MRPQSQSSSEPPLPSTSSSIVVLTPSFSPSFESAPGSSVECIHFPDPSKGMTFISERDHQLASLSRPLSESSFRSPPLSAQSPF